MIGRPRFEVFLGSDGQGYWRLRAANGEIVAHSEGYTDGIRGARRGTKALVGTVLGLFHLDDASWEILEVEPDEGGD